MTTGRWATPLVGSSTDWATLGVRARLDDNVATAFGRRATDWELKGVPVRIELGPRDLAERRAVLVRRDTGEKRPVGLDALSGELPALLESIQAQLLADATALRDDRTTECATVDEAADAAAIGFARVPWSLLDGAALERLGRDAVTVRCVQRPDGSVPEALDEPGQRGGGGARLLSVGVGSPRSSGRPPGPDRSARVIDVPVYRRAWAWPTPFVWAGRPPADVRRAATT